GHLTNRPLAPRFGIAMKRRRCERVKSVIKHGIDGDKLTLQMRRQLSDLDTLRGCDTDQILAISDALRRLFEVDESRVPGWDLHALVTERRSPAANGREIVERRLGAGELREENGRS